MSYVQRINEICVDRINRGFGSTGTGAEKAIDGDRIMGGIRAYQLFDNQKLIATLRAQSKTSAIGMSELERTVAEMERSTSEKNVEIEGLKEELSSSNSSLATLIAMYRDKSQLSDMQRNDLNTAYYAVALGTAGEWCIDQRRWVRRDRCEYQAEHGEFGEGELQADRHSGNAGDPRTIGEIQTQHFPPCRKL